jgi:uncharacterized protein YkwD
VILFPVRSSVHHRPVGPPLSARLRGVLTRWVHLFRRGLRRRTGRLALAALVSAVVTAIVLGVPVVAGSGGEIPGVTLDASSSASPSSAGSPVVMGRDGKPVTSATFAGLQAVATYSAAPTMEAAGSSGREAPTGSASAGGTGATSPTGSRTSGTSGTSGATGSAGTGSEASAPSSTSASGTTTPRPVVPPATDPGSPVVPGPPPPAEPAASSAEEELLGLVNAARVQKGCAALVPDAELAAAAQSHSADMRDAGLLGLQTAAGGSLLDQGGTAVTLANGSADPAAVLDGWMADPADSATLLDCSLGSVGIGLVQAADGAWWTQLLS